eukprot:1449512-Alexandrium_andersonii.AAC.1
MPCASPLWRLQVPEVLPPREALHLLCTVGFATECAADLARILGPGLAPCVQQALLFAESGLLLQFCLGVDDRPRTFSLSD